MYLKLNVVLYFMKIEAFPELAALKALKIAIYENFLKNWLS